MPCLLLVALLAAGPAVELRLPLGRAAYQTNESVDFAVVRRAPRAGELTLVLTADDGSKVTLASAVPAAPVSHVRVDGWWLRPGKYAAAVTVDEATASADFTLTSALRRTPFRLVAWANNAIQGPVQQAFGDEGLGFNTYWSQAQGRWSEHLLRGGLDFMQCCTMSGAHQMDLRPECDWSDPRVVRGGEARVVRQGLLDRAHGNTLGVHFYDEPGLTWAKHPATSETVPHNVPAQDAAFEAVFGVKPPQYHEVKPEDPASVAAWERYARFKLAFCEAAWRHAAAGVTQVRPDYLTANQAMYGWHAFADGYYFNISRALSVNCGHGGYDLWGPGVYHPGLTLAMARARALDQPAWYMPMWDNMSTNRARLEQYASFMQGVAGMLVPPPLRLDQPNRERATEGVVESNRLMARLGPVLASAPPTKPSVALLYSLSQNLWLQERDMTKAKDVANDANYGHVQSAQLAALYLASQRLQTPLSPIVEEDVLDGTLANDYKLVLLPTVEHLDPRVVAALQSYIAGGGTVVLSDDSTQAIEGARKLGLAVPRPEMQPDLLPSLLAGLEPLRLALGKLFAELKLEPVLGSSSPDILAQRQVRGEVEYLFALNAATDPLGDGDYNPLRATQATLSVPSGAATAGLYDAVRGTPVVYSAIGTPPRLTSPLPVRFGAGQLRVLARTPRLIGGVTLSPPIVDTNLARSGQPLALRLGATVVDTLARPIYGGIPVRVRLLEPSGAVRYDLFRCTERGTLELTLPLAVNDAAGLWTVSVTELLSSKEGRATFRYASPTAAAVGGVVPRALMFGPDRARVLEFFRSHHTVSLVAGSGPGEADEAKRLAALLAPWGVRASVVDAATVNHPRTLTEDEARTWVGLGFGRVKPGAGNSLEQVGFDVDGPVVLLGTPETHPLLAFVVKQGCLPYPPDKESCPGPGRGYVAWQRDVVGLGQESLTLVGYDPAGLREAAGGCYEALAGLAPLTPVELPHRTVIERVAWQEPSATASPAGAVPLKVALTEPALRGTAPDRVESFFNYAARTYVLSADGQIAYTTPDYRVLQPAGLTLEPNERVCEAALSADGKSVGYAAGRSISLYSAVSGRLPAVPTAAPVTGLALSPDGAQFAWCDEDGTMAVASTRTGKVIGSSGGEAVGAWRKDLKAWLATHKPGDKAPMPKRPAGGGGQPLLSRDGRSLWVFGAQTQRISLVDGSINSVPGNPRLIERPARLAEGPLLLTDGQTGLLKVDDNTGVATTLLKLPAERPVSVDVAGAELVVATDQDATVRRYAPAEDGKLTLKWERALPGRLPRRVLTDGSLTLVVWWGGWVELLDAAGKPRFSRRFDAEVTAATWSAHAPVVGLSDGQVWAWPAQST